MKTIRNLIPQRVLAIIRSRYPLCYIALGLIAGNLIAAEAYTPNTQIAYGTVLFIMVLFLGISKRRFGWILIVFSGYVSLISNAALPAKDVQEDLLFLMQIEGRPSRPKPHDIRAKIIIKAVYAHSNAVLEKMMHPLEGMSLYCKGGEVPWRNISGVREGDTLLGRIKIKPYTSLIGFFSYPRAQLRRGVSADCTFQHVVVVQRSQGYLAQLRESFLLKFKERFNSELSSGLLLSILLGMRDSIPVGVEENFRVVGLSHLLVFSGAQVVLMYGVIYWIGLRGVFLFTRFFHLYHFAWFPSIIALTIASVFVFFIGVEHSSMRALIALFIAWTASRLERGEGLWNTIWGAAVILLVLWPGSLFEPGVQLTFGALCGIGLSQRVSYRWLVFPCVSLTTSIISVFWFRELSLIGFALNPIVVPLVSGAACTLGLLAVILYVTGIDNRGVVFELMSLPLGWLEEGIVYAARIPGASIKIAEEEVYIVAGVLMLILIMILRYFKVQSLNTSLSRF